MEKGCTLEELLRKALQKLKKEEFYEEYLGVLLSAWYTTVAELKLALSDGAAWSDIQLPGRLKLEMKRMIISIDQKENMDDHPSSSSSSVVGEADVLQPGENAWIRSFSLKDNAYYYYNKLNGTSHWEIPDGESYDDDLGNIIDEKNLESRDLGLSGNVAEGQRQRQQQQQQHFIITDDDRDLSPLDDQFYSPTATAVSAVPVPSCPPFAVIADVYSEESLSGCRPVVASTSTPASSNFGTNDGNDETEVENAGNNEDSDLDNYLLDEEKENETIGSIRRTTPTGLLRSATKGVLNVLGARNRSTDSSNIDTRTTEDSNNDADYADDEDYDEHVRLLCEMGFTIEQASDALVENGNNVTAAASYLVNNTNRHELEKAQRRGDVDVGFGLCDDDVIDSRSGANGLSHLQSPPPPPPPPQPSSHSLSSSSSSSSSYSSSSELVAENGSGNARKGNSKSSGGVSPLFSKGLNLFGKVKPEHQQSGGVAARSGIMSDNEGNNHK